MTPLHRVLCICGLFVSPWPQNLRAAAFYLSKTEIKFDLVSAINELNKQIRLEFDFERCGQHTYTVCCFEAGG